MHLKPKNNFYNLKNLLIKFRNIWIKSWYYILGPNKINKAQLF